MIPQLLYSPKLRLIGEVTHGSCLETDLWTSGTTFIYMTTRKCQGLETVTLTSFSRLGNLLTIKKKISNKLSPPP